MRKRISAAGQWVIAAALLSAAWWLAQHTPSPWLASAPVAETAQLGEPAQGRNITATVTGLRGAPQVQQAEDGDDAILTGSQWLLVDMEAELIETEPGQIAFAELVLGQQHYRATERLDSLFEHPLQIGAPVTGTLAFELPEDTVLGETEPAELQLGLNPYPNMDTIITLEIQPGDVEHAGTARLLPTQWSQPVAPEDSAQEVP